MKYAVVKPKTGAVHDLRRRRRLVRHRHAERSVVRRQDVRVLRGLSRTRHRNRGRQGARGQL